MAAEEREKWKMEVLGFDSAGEPPGVKADGTPTGVPKPVDIADLFDALGDFAAAAGEKLNELPCAPSSFTLEGSVALQILGGVPGIFQFGVESGISVSMTWNFEDRSVLIQPRHGRRTPPPLVPEEEEK